MDPHASYEIFAISFIISVIKRKGLKHLVLKPYKHFFPRWSNNFIQVQSRIQFFISYCTSKEI